jgi:hypothetical protein
MSRVASTASQAYATEQSIDESANLPEQVRRVPAVFSADAFNGPPEFLG